MTILTHQFVSQKTDGPDATKVRPSDWNASHAVSASQGDILYAPSANTLGALNVSATSGAILRSTGSVPAWTTLLKVEDTKATLTVPLLLPDGSQSAPSLAFASSTGTGIWTAGSNTLIFGSAGTNMGALRNGQYSQFASPLAIGGTITIPDTALSRLSAATIGIGNGTAGNISGYAMGFGFTVGNATSDIRGQLTGTGLGLVSAGIVSWAPASGYGSVGDVYNVKDTVISRYAAKQLMISGDGTGATTNAGWILGYYGSSGYGALWPSSQGTPTTSNPALISNGSNLYLNAAANLNFQVGATTVMQVRPSSSVGEGISIAAGAATADYNALSITQTMNAAAVAFTGIKATFTQGASGTAAGTKLLDILYGTSGSEASVFNVTKGGNLRAAQGSSAAPTYSFISSTNTGMWQTSDVLVLGAGGSDMAAFRGGGSGYSQVASPLAIGATITVPDTYLHRDAAGVLAQRNSTNAQVFNVYNTYTDASNYERFGIVWSSNILYLTSENAGTGTNRNIQINTNAGSIYLATANTQRWQVNSSGHLLPGANNTYDIGSSALKLRSAFVQGTATLASVELGNTGSIYWNAGSDGTASAVMTQDAAYTIGMRNSTNPHTLRIYGTYTNASNYEMLEFGYNGAEPWIATKKAGTGGDRAMYIGPNNATGSLNLVSGATTRWKIDGSTGHLLAPTDNSYDIGASGATRPRDLYLAGVARISNQLKVVNDIQLGNLLSADVSLYAPGSGVLRVTNGASNDFDRMQLGGTTSSFPALKRSSTALHARLADDSGYAPFSAAAIVANGNLNVTGNTYLGAATRLYFDTRSAITSPADGTLSFSNNAENATALTFAADGGTNVALTLRSKGTGALTLNATGVGSLVFGSGVVAPAGSGQRYLVIDTSGVVTSSASAPVGT